MDKHERERRLSRRDAIKVCLAPAGIAATSWLVGCVEGDDDAEAEREQSESPTGSDREQRDAGAKGDGRGATDVKPNASFDAGAARGNGGSPLDARATAPEPSSDAGTIAPEVSADARVNSTNAGADAAPVQEPNPPGSGDVTWASGGTKSMRGGYPDPFLMDEVGTACQLYPAQTIGPCYAETTQREDISDGQSGLPLRLSFLVVDSDGCTPVPNAEVDIWSAGAEGIYSAYEAGSICTGLLFGPSTEGETYCRGKRKTDENGRVDFSTVFPGWYSGRAVHIHFTVRAGGQEYITSQLYFDDALIDEIQAQGEYAARGQRDTRNGDDGILSGSGTGIQQFLFSTAKRPDGVLHAWKVLAVTT